MFDVFIVATTLCAWGFGLWCYPKCIHYVSSTCFDANSSYEDEIIVDEATATLSYPIYYTDEVINFDEEIMNEICMNNLNTSISQREEANNIIYGEKYIDENLNEILSNQICIDQEIIPVAKLINRGYIYCT